MTRIAEQYFPGVELSAEAKDHIAAKDIRAAKVVLHSGESAVVYTNDHVRPQWIELKDVIAPTVYGAWDAPFVLPLVVTVPYTVDRLQNGAHLMIPGIFEPLPEHAPAGSVVGISLTTSPNVPVAVGITLVDCSRGVLDPDSAEGRAVQIVNIIGDTLWDTYKGDKTIPKDLDRAIPASEGDGAAGGESSKSTGSGGEPASEPTGQPPEQKDSVDELAANLADAKTEDSPAGGSTDSTETPEPESTTDDSLTAEEVDEAFRMALLQVIKKKALGEDIELPISSSQLVSSHILPNLPYKHPGLQMKKTSWKKAAKFFKQAEKDGLVKYRERGGEGVVLSFAGGDHPTIQQFQIYKVKARKPGAASSNKKDTDTTKMTAIEYFRPRSAASPLFTAAGLSASGVYPAPVLRDVVNKYIGEHNLVDTKDKKQVVLDDVLAKALGAPATQRTIGRDKLVSSLQSNSAPFHIIAPQGRERDFKPAKGPIPTILVATERRGGHKIVTLISGLEKFHIDPVTFFEKLRVACAGSGSVNDLRADSDLKQVMIQGNQVTQVVHLLEQHGVRPAWIETKSKK